MKKLCLAATLCGLAAAALHAREFRTLRPVSQDARASLPEGAEPVAKVAPLPADTVHKAAERMMSEWNQPGMEETLHKDFYDRSRLVDATDEKVPRDAKVNILGISDVQTLSQYRAPAPEGGAPLLTSRVSATIRTQILYNDAEEGFKKVEGVNEYIFEITEEEVSD